MGHVFLNQFRMVEPRNRISQGDLLDWIIRCHQLAAAQGSEFSVETADRIEKLFQRYGVKSAQISERYLECDDVQSTDFALNKIYKIDEQHADGVSITERTTFFSERAYEVFLKMYELEKNTARPDHLIHVTCTGYISPSAAQRIVTEPQWNHSTDITHAYHMGCYAAMPAVRLAKSLVNSEGQHFTTDIVHTEMCGLHMNPLAQTPEQMVVQTLFADGHIKYTATGGNQHVGRSLKVIAMHEKVVPGSQQDMSWVPAPWGMQMNLSREVPEKIKQQLKIFSDELFKKAKIETADALKSIFAIHPGGPKIIDAVQSVLELSDNQVSESKKILFERGNMSSATLPHVWSEIIERGYPIGTRIVSYAFGPGLTLFGSVFEVS